MRKVVLRMNELEKYIIIKDLVDHNGNKKRAAKKLGLIIRQINRLIKIYKEKGKTGFVHGNRSRKPVNSIENSLSETIILLYTTKYQDCNFSHFRDLLETRENIKVSYYFIYTTLTKHNIYFPKIRKSTKKRFIKKI